MTDRIVIRAWKGEEHNPIALFMDQPEPGGLVNSYQPIGQHGAADPIVIYHGTVPVDPSGPIAERLVVELRSLGYEPTVLRRFQRRRAAP